MGCSHSPAEHQLQCLCATPHRNTPGRNSAGILAHLTLTAGYPGLCHGAVPHVIELSMRNPWPWGGGGAMPDIVFDGGPLLADGVNCSARATDPMPATYLPPFAVASPRSPSIPLTPYPASIPPASPVLSSFGIPTSANVSSQHSRPSSAHSSRVQDILFSGDIIGQGLDFQGGRVRLLPIYASHHNGGGDLNTPSLKFEAVKALGIEATPPSTKSARSCPATHHWPKISCRPTL